MSLPSPDATYEVKNAKNPALNGIVTFRYPDMLTQIQIGSREAELANFGRRLPINPQDLPANARMMLLATATLEYTIQQAPQGWYIADERAQPLLNPGRIGNGDEGVVLDVFQAYLRFREAVRNPVPETEPRKPDGEGVVSGGDTDGGTDGGAPDAADGGADIET